MDFENIHMAAVSIPVKTPSHKEHGKVPVTEGQLSSYQPDIVVAVSEGTM
jgi:hypothetical protein